MFRQDKQDKKLKLKEMVGQPFRLIKPKATNRYRTSETLVLPTPPQKPHE